MKLHKIKDKIKKIFRIDKDNTIPNKIRAEEFNKINPQTLEVVPTRQNTKIIGDNWLISYKDNLNSEHGEDGIIEKIFSILKPQNKWVCEFGAHDPEIISNTWRLINKEEWNAM